MQRQACSKTLRSNQQLSNLLTLQSLTPQHINTIVACPAAPQC